MCVQGHLTIRSIVFLFTIGAAFAGSATTSFAQDKGAPPWGEFLPKGRWPGFDKLLRKPFRMAPEEEVKGLAAKLRARELDIPNRQRAVKYLAKFHCATFPEARDMLVDVLINDRWEPVRLEAAVGLAEMFSNCACGADNEVTLTDIRRGAPDAGAGKHCSCCCDANTLNALAKVAYELKDNGCCFEPSLRVREAAVEAIRVCGIPCCYKPYMEGSEQAPPAWEPVDVDDVQKKHSGEAVPPPSQELQPIPTGANDGGLTIPSIARVPVAPISRLQNICVVSLKQGRQVGTDQRFAATYKGRRYFFASEAAQKEFERSPEDYAVAFGGCDPVHFVDTQQVLEGRFLTLHGGKLYMFASEANYQRFSQDISRYSGNNSGVSQVALVD